MRIPGFRRVFGRLRGDAVRHVDDELQSHIEMKAEDLRRGGLAPGVAEQEARERFGDVRTIRRECRRLQAEAEGRRSRGDFMDELMQDIRFAHRTLRRNPGFSVVAIVTLALGIGANTAIFSVVNGLMLRPLPGIEEPGRLVEISQGDGDDFVSVSYPVFRHVREAAATLDGYSLHNQSVSAGYFSALSLPLLRGRTFRRADNADAPMVAVINETMAKRFWSIDAALGQTFTLAGREVEVIGVVTDGRYHRLVEDTPLFAYFTYRQRPRTDMYLHLKAAPGADIATAWSAVRRVVARLDPEVPFLSVAPLSEALQIFFLPQLFAAWITGVVGAFGLLLGAVGIYGVTAYTASRRSHEIGIRLALGAGARDVRRMMVRQGMVAPLIGLGIGLALAAALTRLLGSFLVDVSPLDPLTFGVALGLLGSVALVATLIPARRAARVDPVVTLKTE